jgi:hypothetical protein
LPEKFHTHLALDSLILFYSNLSQKSQHSRPNLTSSFPFQTAP